VWEAVRELVAGGTTVLLTTQYLDEADQLADRICVIDAGRAIAEGTPEDLKSRVGADRIDVVVRSPGELPSAASVVGRVCDAEPDIDRESRRVSVPVTDRLSALTGTVRALDDAGVDAEDIGLRRPTLDDVFLRLTGHRAGEVEKEVAA
jgi:ABC-2 type transport system ATP-binding protein